MSYQMRGDAKGRNAGRFVLRVQNELQKALGQSGLRQQQVAERLGVDRSIINRRLTGRANLTLRSIADMAWAMDHDLVFSLKPRMMVVGTNEHNLPVASQLTKSGGEVGITSNVTIQIGNKPTGGEISRPSETRNRFVVHPYETA